MPLSADLQHRIKIYPQPCLCVGSEGIIKIANISAILSLSINVGQNINESNFISDTGETLSICISRIVQERNYPDGMVYLRCCNEHNLKPTMLGILPILRGEKNSTDALVFVIEPRWTHKMRSMVAELYNLTEAELDILFLFLDGLSIDEVAKVRARSRATIRTQFNTILSKCGIQRQAHLMRELLLSLSFSGHTRPLEQSANHPYRRTFQVLRPMGRCVDLVIAGDMNGRMAIFLTVPCLHGFSSRLEADFRNAGICIGSMARPGFGRTDLPLSNQSVMDCLTGDIEAVLQQLNIRQVTLIASGNSLLPAMEFATRRPDRVQNILSINTQPPKPFFDQCGMEYGSAIMQSAEVANHYSPELLTFALRAAIQGWISSGVVQNTNKSTETHQSTTTYLDEIDQRAIFEEAIEVATQQGIGPIIDDFPPLLSDWRSKIENCPSPITILHGTMDRVHPIDPVRSMRDAYQEKINLVEINGADQYLYVTHRKAFVNYLYNLIMSNNF